MKRKFMVPIISLVLLVSLIVPSTATILETRDTIQTSELNELNVRIVVSTYFSQRKSLLSGVSDIISVAVDPIVVDELTHKAALLQAGYTFVDSEIVIDEISCGNYMATVTVTEILTLSIGGEAFEQSVLHELVVFLADDGNLVVGSDGYHYAVFTSASYVPTEVPNLLNDGTGGSGPCIVAVAAAEVGIQESSNGETKYGVWFGDYKNSSVYDAEEWCAMFVSWCANQANVPNTIIKYDAVVGTIKNFFAPLGRYYLSNAHGGTYIPQPGDLFFWGTSQTSPAHIGIVEKVDSTYVYLIDGNNISTTPPGVSSYRLRLSNTSLLGFANPNYSNAAHQYPSGYQWDELQHWKVCGNCGLGKIAARHTLTTDALTGTSRCTECPYGWQSIIQWQQAMVDLLLVDDNCSEYNCEVISVE